MTTKDKTMNNILDIRNRLLSSCYDWQKEKNSGKDTACKGFGCMECILRAAG